MARTKPARNGIAPRELCALRRAVPGWLEDAENGLAARFKLLLAGLYNDLQLLDERVRELDREIAAIAREHEPVSRLQQVTGIGPLTASALYLPVGDGRYYRNGRELAVALGLTPRQHSSGGAGRPACCPCVRNAGIGICHAARVRSPKKMNARALINGCREIKAHHGLGGGLHTCAYANPDPVGLDDPRRGLE
jgi:transposase